MNDAEPNLILIGLRASGKSTLGRLLAQELGRDFVDLDELVARQMNASGPGEIIEREGIDAFRSAETEALRSVLNTSGQILALGGGTPTAPGASELLRDSDARIFYLKATPETLRARLARTDNTDRPSLTGDDVVDEVQALFEQRDPLYRSLAESVVHVDGVSEASALRALFALASIA
jgi:shikimate kinase